MRRKELLQLIEEGENLHCEFKLRFSSHEKIAKEMIAFANTKGGYMIFGIDDDKTVVGVQSEKGEAELIKEAASQYCEPPVKFSLEYIDLNNKEIVVAGIPESDEKPHRLQDYLPELDITKAQVYVRVNDKSMLASKEMVRILRADAQKTELVKYVVGSNEKIVFDYLDKNETINVKLLSRLANISERRASRTLVKLVRARMLLIHTKDNGEEFFTYTG
ncbi:MAG: ATP-binding protein [Ignavibacteria bacterium]|jgi:predicted HTH transcriptional regulator|nr:ATP-binding protein [Ignavibacteria bacterium]MCU7526140.1 ATP-binding protein [Ignavibacteria bacterium]